ncbi:TolC family protein [Marivita sp. GX14005]|uniref:TolC family protein n=1 Tax=Marivita sp. GX14005 TaxID=2942276 RepID=UPI0020188354|nr:TolC family protein [Marivita sp. GX14005]MCL3882218.1 TolC family protein [Marivita sp. GX14005]
MRQSRRAIAGALLAATALSGCLKDVRDGDAVSRFLNVLPGAEGPRVPPATDRQAAVSPVILDLSARQSVLEPGTPYAEVAAGVLAADARVAEAELQVAQLRAEAASRNWLPTLSPRVSLTSLGDLVADLVLNQVLFDNGRKKAERDLAKADVELAAVALSESSNSRVHEGLSLYLQAEEGRAASRLYAQALDEMARFEWVMQERVRGGVSDLSDLSVVRQKLANLRARHAAAEEKTVRAVAELEAMASVPLGDLRGLGDLRQVTQVEPPEVLRVMVERDRQLAKARIARAQHLPGLSLGGSARGGADSVTLTGSSDTPLGFGTGAALRAAEAGKLTADRKVTEARDLARRAIEADAREQAALARQAEEAALLTRQAKENLDLFRLQYESGTRQVMDVVGVYETFLRALEKELDLKYRAARARLDAAKRLGVLADGARI